MKKGHKLTDDSTIAELKSLSASELNSFSLELFQERASSRNPSEVLEQFQKNRFVLSSDIDAISIRETELEWLKTSKDEGFAPIVLSPLAPLGTSSSVAHVHQNNVISALYVEQRSFQMPQMYWRFR